MVRSITIFLFMHLMILSSKLQAADTIEPFALGASDAEFYLGYNGLGDENTFLGETVLGIGLTHRISMTVGLSMTSNSNFGDTVVGLGLGGYGTIVDTDHFDLDLLLDLGTEINADTSLALAPGFEMNVDLKPDLQLWGIYLRTWISVHGLSPEDPDEDRWKTGLDIPFEVGTYLTLGHHHQLLIGFDGAANSINSAAAMYIGSVALGYNVCITDAVELINQVSLNIPDDDEQLSFSLSIGLLVTL